VSREGGPHKPGLDEMCIALSHEVKPARSGDRLPRRSPQGEGGRSKLGRPGMRGGWKRR
jgi:hypothetical protein